MPGVFIHVLACGVVLGANTCQTTFGASASCLPKAQCGAGKGTWVPGQCQDDPAVECCLGFTMKNAFKYFSANIPWQKTALDNFQSSTLSKLTVQFSAFSCKFRNQPDDNSGCGKQILMSNVATYYNELPHQVDALEYLQSVVEGLPDQQAWQLFVKTYRALGQVSGGPPAISVAGCSRGPVSSKSFGPNGLAMLTHFEGWHACCYLDSESIWTIGYGHACHIVSNDGSGCLSGNRCQGCLSREKGMEFLKKDLRSFESCVKTRVKVPVSQNQYDALVSFAFNVGCGAFSESTLLRLLNAGILSPHAAQQQFTRWHSSCTEGLKRRRFAEAELFNSCLETFPCSYSGCAISYKYPDCAGTCAYCSRCGGCRSRSRAQRFSPLELSVLAISEATADNEAWEDIAVDKKPESWVCRADNSQDTAVGVNVTALTACAAVEPIPSGSSPAEKIAADACKAMGTPTAMKTYYFEDLNFDVVTKIIGQSSQISVTFAETFADATSSLVMEVFAPSTADAEDFQLFMVPDDPDAVIASDDIPVQMVVSRNSTGPGTGTSSVSGAGSLSPGKISTILAAVLVGSCKSRNMLVPSAVVLAPVVFGQPSSASCSPFIRLTIYLPREGFDSVVGAVGTDQMKFFNVVDVKTRELELSRNVDEDCGDPAVAGLFSLTCLNSGNRTKQAKYLPLPAAEPKFLLENAFRYYDDVNYPHQKCALGSFESALSEPRFSTAFAKFACDFRDKVGTAADPSCGAAIKLVNVKTYWKSLPHQVNAAQNLQRTLEQSAPSTWVRMVKEWRNQEVCVSWPILPTGKCGGEFGCRPDTNYCCSVGGWCGQTDAHCNGGKDWRTPNSASTPSAAPIVLKGRACAGNHPLIGKPGVCLQANECTSKGAQTAIGLCPNDPSGVLCCAGDPKQFKIEFQTDASLCGDYSGDETLRIAGNNNVMYTVVKIKSNHLVSPSYFNYAPDKKDNTIEVKASCAWEKMRQAAWNAGAYVKIASGFRTVARQNYFWNCYKCGCCNGGNLAAYPGSSNHGRGRALDLNTNCGRQSGSRPPYGCTVNAVYKWLYNNAAKFGWKRTVQSEPWHWEYSGEATTTRTWYS